MRFSIGLLALLFATSAFAQQEKTSSETKVKLEDVKGGEKKDDQADEIITNRMERAKTGSLSKLSVSTGWSFSGGSIERPLDGLRPNILGAPGALVSQSLAGGISGTYRLSTQNRLSAGISMSWIAPFTDTATVPTGTPPADRQAVQRNFDANNDQIDFYNPNVNFTRIGRLGPLQSTTSSTLTVTTNRFNLAQKQVAGLGVSQTLLYDFGKSRATVGVSMSAGYTFYSVGAREFVTMGSRRVMSGRANSDLTVGIFPLFEFVINDRLNFRTLTGFMADQLRLQSDWDFTPRKIYQSAGIGIMVTRDVFLYPNIQFLPENPRSDLTNVAISANINIF